MQKYAKRLGRVGESLVIAEYLSLGYELVEKNYTIPGGEIDLIVTTPEELVFVEAKVVDHIDDLDGYITPRKLSALKRTIDVYLYEHPTHKTLRLDVVFVKQGKIIEHYIDVTNR